MRKKVMAETSFALYGAVSFCFVCLHEEENEITAFKTFFTERQTWKLGRTWGAKNVKMKTTQSSLLSIQCV